ncbi:MAG: hypothetical protein P8P69_02800 [Ilumatobacter sp.]|nr:hypothetical protein [Ilumatobacter sp.]MDG1390955.1 hypothetical protein [Ilumatobacter sp.]MDG1785123.1 hypothetical protein [Ilumatobacter sp.]
MSVPDDEPRARTVSDVVVETMVNWGVTAVFGMVGHSNFGFADGMRVAEERGDLRFSGSVTKARPHLPRAPTAS